MKKRINLILLAAIFSICFTGADAAQKRKTPQTRKPARARPTPPPESTPRSIGSPVVIMTKSGQRITGAMVDLTAYSIRIKSGNLESAVPLETIASISFGNAQVPESEPVASPSGPSADFSRDGAATLKAFELIASEIKAGLDYTEYGRQLADLRQQVERFIEKYSYSDNEAEARAVALAAGALTDYNWARTIWTLKLGRSSDGTVTDADSQAVADALSLHADLRAAATSGNKFSADKIVAGLWRKASEKVDRMRDSSGQQR